MRRNQSFTRLPQPPRVGQVPAAPRRGGAVIILSLAMLMSLLFLGLFFFSFVDDESRSADIYARQSQPVQAVSNKHVLNHGLSQVVVGTNDSDPNELYFAPYSALFGGRYSMLAHIIGPVGEHDWDRTYVNSGVMAGPSGAEDLDSDGYFDPWTPTDYDLFNGAGVKVFWNGTSSTFEIDTNNDGTNDVPGGLASLRLHVGPLAGGGVIDPTLPQYTFDADAGYTYPDLNSLFLYHQSKLYEDDNYNGVLDPGEDRNGNGSLDFYTAIKPSFEAPAVLNAPTGYTAPSNAAQFTAGHVMRPHNGHQFPSYVSSPPVMGTPSTRYITEGSATNAAGRTVNGIETQYVINHGGTNPISNERMGVWNRMGTASGDTYDFHADADGDGVNDAFLIDLDYPLIEFPDGRGAVPLYFWRIEDLDALVNLNTAGDMPLYRLAERRASGAPNRAALLTALNSDARFLTGANYGQSPSEINPGIPLISDPSDGSQFSPTTLVEAAEQYNAYYQEQTGSPPPFSGRVNIANTELLWLMTGRHSYDSAGVLPEEYDIAGRYGETLGLDPSGLLPAAGNTGADAATNTANDDDGDGNRGVQPNGGAAYREWFRVKSGAKVGQPQVRSPITMPPAVHPLDGTGFGVWLTGAAGTDVGLRRLFRDSPDTNNPSQWLHYNSLGGTPFGAVPMWQFQVAAAAGVAPWLTALQAVTGSLGYLQAHNPANPVDAFWDEPDEMVVDDSDPTFLNPADQPFPASEMTGLWASNADWTRLNITSRLRDLAPINFTINFLAQEIRRQFTTVSWDRPEFGMALDLNRNWERTSNVFPPAFGSVGTSPPTYANGGIVANDPLRPELRRLLHVNFNAQRGNAHPQQRLELNGILSDDSLGGAAASSCFDKNGNPRFRPLVPHPVFDSATDATFTPSGMIHNNGAAVPHAFSTIGTSKQAQEWWARYDRQRLARDIYTLLWITGAPPALNTVAATHPYTVANGFPDNDGDGRSDVIDEMAQFAVNLVDAMDHDSVVTQFQFDPDLGDGWSYTPGPTAPVKLGLESPTLTFSEALWIKSLNMGAGNDHDATLFDDSTGDHHFLFLELRNALPLDIPLGQGTFRLRRLTSGTTTEVAAVTLDGALASAPTVGGGENYLIGTHDGTFTVVGGTNAGKQQAAIFWLDHQLGGTLNYFDVAPYLIDDFSTVTRPAGADATAARQIFPNPLCDLDLNHERDTAKFTATANLLTAPPGTGDFELVLERRANPLGDGLLEDDATNPWVEVDRVKVRQRDFQLNPSDNQNQVRQEFRRAVRSQERREPLFPHMDAAVGGSPTWTNISQPGDGLIDYGRIAGIENGFIKHSLGGPSLTDAQIQPWDGTLPAGMGQQPPPDPDLKHQRNSALEAAEKFDIWLPHFDRGYTSVYDLLSVQLLAPSQLIFHDQSTAPEGGLVEAMNYNDTLKMTGIHAAAMRFLNPQGTLPAHLSGHQAEHYANRWYRLLEFLSVPSHTSDEVADRMSSRRRVPGKINLNTVRSEYNLAAAINDRDQLNLTSDLAITTNGLPTDDRFFPTGGAAPLTSQRNWYLEMRRARDGVNASDFTVFPPGTPYSLPFRPLTYDDPLNPTNPLASTILRNHSPGAAASLPTIGLFEARNPADVNNDSIDWHTRNRILSRIANLTTNRSHVYVIFGGFQLHEAYEATPGDDVPNVRIGARMTSEPVYREMIVVDMSRLEEGYDTATGAFNFEGFILHREVLP